MNYAIILAAGKGTRMNTSLPKCAFPILKRPMIEYILDTAEKSKVDKIITVVGYKKEEMAEILKDRVEYVVQEHQLGTGHAVNCCKKLIDKDGYTVILPGDVPLVDEEIINKVIDKHVRVGNDLTIVTAKENNPTGYGRILRNRDKKVYAIVEEADADGYQLEIKETNTGIMCVNNKVLFSALKEVKNENAKGEYYLTDIVSILGKRNAKIGSVCVEDSYKVRGVNDLYELSVAESTLRREIVKKHLYSGVHIVNPESVTIGPNVVIGMGTTIYQGTMIYGSSIIGSNAVVGPYSELNNAVIEDNAKCIQSLVNDSKICKGATVGPFTHLRMNTIVGENDRIGNFVEIKNSKIGSKTNVSHLTYIGDTTCGSQVNWGCGTVTVNYDGKNKFRTEIGDKVFIGCNTNLIAPVKIGDNAFIAAGSTITQDLDKGAFAIARAVQVTKDEYAKKYGFKIDKKEDEKMFEVIRCKDYAEASKVACEIFTEAIEANPNITLGLATGSTPIGTYKNLIKNYKNKRISFKNVKTYNLDEYVGLPSDHPETYYNFMHTNLFNHVDILEENVHVPHADKDNMEESCKAYSNMLNSTTVDIQLLGIGANGHIGFNEPGTSFDQETFIVELTEKTRDDNKRFFNSIDEVPTHAMTMGIKNILNSKKIVLMATGENKAEAVKMLLSKKVTTDFPASALHLHKDVVVIIDEEAAKLLEE